MAPSHLAAFFFLLSSPLSRAAFPLISTTTTQPLLWLCVLVILLVSDALHLSEISTRRRRRSRRMRTVMAPRSPTTMAALQLVSSAVFLSSLAASSSGSSVGVTCHGETKIPPWVSVDLFVDEQTISWRTESRLLEQFRLLSTMIRGSAADLPVFLPAMIELLQEALRSSGTGHGAELSVVFPPPTLEMLSKSAAVGELTDIFLRSLKELDTSVALEIQFESQLSLEEDSVQSLTQRAVDLCGLLPRIGVPIVLFVKSSPVPNEAETDGLAGSIEKVIERTSGLFQAISLMMKEPEDQLFFHSYRRRELLGHESKLMAGRKTLLRDAVTPVFNPAAPVFNPVTTPSVNVPSTNPTPAVVTVPSVDPGSSIMPTTPISVPSTNPFSPVTTLPGTNPVTTTPITNPTTNPFMTVPGGGQSTTTNPATTYPVTPAAGGTPSTVPFSPATGIPATNPGTYPVPGQSWCVAKAGVPDSVLQSALDYACGIADCSAIQTTGSCYNPNSLQSHASYAFNSYYQRNPVSTSCDFGGTAAIIGINPSSGICLYPASSSTSVFNPPSTAGVGAGAGVGFGAGAAAGGASYGAGGAATGFGAGSGSNSSGGSSTVFGSDTSDGGRGRSTSSGQPLMMFLTICLLLLLHI